MDVTYCDFSLLLFLLLGIFSECSGFIYLGCHMETLPADRLFPDKQTDFRFSQTIESCITVCSKDGYKYIGLQNSFECFCSNKRPTFRTLMDEESCNHKCSGNGNQICGGSLRLSVYDISGENDSSVQENYLGCYLDKSETRMLNKYKVSSELLTPELCIGSCYRRGFRFAGLYNGNECGCGDSIPTNMKVDNSECLMNCQGNRNFMCGDKWKLSIYYTEIPDNPISQNYLGCFKDNVTPELLSTRSFDLTTTNSPRKCMNLCLSESFRYSGTRNGFKCFCGNRRPNQANEISESHCISPCTGEPRENCGGNDIEVVRIFSFAVAFTPMTVYDTGSDSFNYLGCHMDKFPPARLLSIKHKDFRGSLTIELCSDHCKATRHNHAGLQNRYECFCSDKRPTYKTLVDEEDCNHKCDGNNNQICGGALRLSVYDISGKSSNAVADNFIGCYSDNSDNRMLKGDKSIIRFLTSEICVGFCYRRGYRIAGQLQGNVCLCDDSILPGNRITDFECSTACDGDKNLKCGANSSLSIYHTGISDNPIDQNGYEGCFKEGNFNSLSAKSFEYKTSNSAKKCMNICLTEGFSYSGTQDGFKCFCGNQRPNESGKVNDSKCNKACLGDPTKHCGGRNSLSIYATGKGKVKPSFPELEPLLVNCVKSRTFMNGKNPCSGEVIFKEDFNTKMINNDVWSQAVYISSAPDHEFVIFTGSPNNIFTVDGKLKIKPTILDDEFITRDKIKLENCTGSSPLVSIIEECERQATAFNIIPPVESAKIHTRNSFTFKYGILRIRAKLPIGDWIVPNLLLEPFGRKYGTEYSNGKIMIALARGGLEDEFSTGFGVRLGVGSNVKSKILVFKKQELWYNEFHNFTLTWTPENMAFSVDDEPEHLLLPSWGTSLRDQLGFSEKELRKWNDGSILAPFDQEFYISLGLSVGGMRDFPNDIICTSGKKPWKNWEVKALMKFWKAKNNWLPTWNNGNSDILVDSVTVTAL